MPIANLAITVDVYHTGHKCNYIKSISYSFEEIGDIEHMYYDESDQIFNLISQTANAHETLSSLAYFAPILRPFWSFS